MGLYANEKHSTNSPADEKSKIWPVNAMAWRVLSERQENRGQPIGSCDNLEWQKAASLLARRDAFKIFGGTEYFRSDHRGRYAQLKLGKTAAQPARIGCSVQVLLVQAVHQILPVLDTCEHPRDDRVSRYARRQQFAEERLRGSVDRPSQRVLKQRVQET